LAKSNGDDNMEITRIIAVIETRSGFSSYSDLLKLVEKRLEATSFYISEAAGVFQLEFGLTKDEAIYLLGVLGEMGFIKWSDGTSVSNENIPRWMSGWKVYRSK
jgi:hypothetical protein